MLEQAVVDPATSTFYVVFSVGPWNRYVGERRLAKVDSAGSVLWSWAFVPEGRGSIALGPDGSVYGIFEMYGTYPELGSVGGVRLMHYSREGQLLWHQPQNCASASLASLPNGDVAVSSTGCDTDESVHIRKYNSSGTALWSRTFPPVFEVVAAAPDNGLLAAGYFPDGFSFQVDGLRLVGRTLNPVVARLGKTGMLEWAQVLDARGKISAVASLQSGQAVVVGTFSGSFSTPTGTRYASEPTTFVARVDRRGLHWVRTADLAGPCSLALSSDNIYVAATDWACRESQLLNFSADGNLLAHSRVGVTSCPTEDGILMTSVSTQDPFRVLLGGGFRGPVTFAGWSSDRPQVTPLLLLLAP